MSNASDAGGGTRTLKNGEGERVSFDSTSGSEPLSIVEVCPPTSLQVLIFETGLPRR